MFCLTQALDRREAVLLIMLSIYTLCYISPTAYIAFTKFGMVEAHVSISLHAEAEIESDAQFPDFRHFVRKGKYSYFPQYLHNFHQNFTNNIFRTVMTLVRFLAGGKF